MQPRGRPRARRPPGVLATARPRTKNVARCPRPASSSAIASVCRGSGPSSKVSANRRARGHARPDRKPGALVKVPTARRRRATHRRARAAVPAGTAIRRTARRSAPQAGHVLYLPSRSRGEPRVPPGAKSSAYSTSSRSTTPARRRCRGPLACPPRPSPRTRRVVEQLAERSGESGHVVGAVDHQPVDAVAHHQREAGQPAGDDRQARTHALQQHHPERGEAARRAEDVGACEVAGAQPVDAPAKSTSSRSPAEPSARPSAAAAPSPTMTSRTSSRVSAAA